MEAMGPLTQPVHRIRAAVLYNMLDEEFNRRSSHRAPFVPSAFLPSPFQPSAQPQPRFTVDNIICMNNQLVDSAFDRPTDRKTVKDLEVDVARWEVRERNQVKMVDLSRCNLFSEKSIGDILAVVRLFPNLEYLDLSGNCLDKLAWDAGLSHILAIQSLLYINIVGNNNLVSADNEPFFQQLDPSVLTKLIWIPRAWVPTHNWNVLLHGRSADDIEKIAGAHNTFYEVVICRIPTPSDSNGEVECFYHIFMNLRR